MAAQDIPLSIAAEQDKKHFRLLELPAELLSTILAAESPILELKSSSKEGGGEDSEGNAVLCTADKTYRIRQKNSSNSVYILQPTEQTSSNGVLAVAQSHSTLELSDQSDSQAITHLRRLVPLYSSTGLSSSAGASTLREAFEAVPYSASECTAASIELATAIDPDSSRVIRPSAQTRIDVWRTMLETSLALDIPLSAPIDEDRARKLTTESSRAEAAIGEAILRATGLLQTAGGPDFSSQHCARWLGTALLEVEAPRAAIPSQEFVAKWQDLLLEGWRSEAAPTLLKQVAIVSDGGRSIRCDQSVFASDSASATGSSNDIAAGAQKRKWHEKFRPSK